MSQLENCTKPLAMLYNRGMAKITVSEARERLSEVVETSRTEAVVFERYGQPAAILISPDRYEKMMEALEEVQDIAAFDEAMSEEGGNIPWEQVKADLGWS
jgi:antitoxin Phd